MNKISTCFFLQVLIIISGSARAQEPPMTEVKLSRIHDLGDLMSVQGHIEKPSLMVVAEEMDSKSLLQKLQAEAWQDLEGEALRSASVANRPDQ
ncbi:MAG: hypothetical protein WCH11_00900 [Bdellovibrio sp.]